MSLQDLFEGAPYQDFIVLAGQTSPGLAVVRGANVPRNWDIRAGYGLTGATVVYMGDGLAKFDVDIFVWLNPSHFAAWRVFAKRALTVPAGVRPTSLSIQHPALNDAPLTIRQVVVEDVTQWEQSPEGGLWARTIKFLQYRAPKPVLVRPAEGIPGSPINASPPVDPEQMQIAANNAQIAKLNR